MIAPGAGDLKPFAQADVLLLLARLLGRPDDSTGSALDATEAELADLARHAAPGCQELLESLVAGVRAAQDLDPLVWGDEHSRLFEGAVVCPVNETAFVRRDKGAILADICGFYNAFGFDPAEDSGEKADHLITELEFLALLLVMLAQAREAGDAERAEVVLGGVRAFAGDHLDEWLHLFGQRLEGSTALGLYRHVVAALGLATDAVFADHDVPRSDRERADFPLDDTGSPYECGMAACAKEEGSPELLEIDEAIRPPTPG